MTARFVAGLKLWEVHYWTVTAAAICRCCGRIADGITFHGGLCLWNACLRRSVQWQDWWLHLLWWGELEAVPGITNLHKFTHKIRASFYIPEVWSGMFPEEGYSAPPAPQSLNREAYLPDKLAYQDIRWQPVFLTVAYCQCLQHWVEKCNLLGNLNFWLLAESVRELRQAVHEFVNITQEDVMEGLKMEEPEGGCWPSPTTIFSQVLSPPANRQESVESSNWPKDRAIQCTPPPLSLE